MNSEPNEETRVFNTFVSNESQILESLKLIQNNQEELNQIMNDVEGRVAVFEQGEILTPKKKAEPKSKKKICKNAVELFMENQDDLPTDVEMLQDEKRASPVAKQLNASKANVTWKELALIWNTHQNLVVLREYRCDYCQKTFSKKTALGGHTSKHHPNKSTDYQYRQRSLKNRQIERERQKFYKTLKASDFV